MLVGAEEGRKTRGDNDREEQWGESRAKLHGDGKEDVGV